ncbi:cyclohexadienyl dehydratase [Variovorax paradoxus]|uniref:transporter substrate-binding domain-containing protein n=1 Tax=Variovorax paradoxus TaxID=34073 RepID=UPI00277D7518|nr:transporter substrate-binding domain-containing protein [Variovorax paradoxus]MDP9931504.1 cyclohexadienyl dehydratase [Variovorax paradoxus]MDQ0025116.1 cyclohexadienyl dehydratase [Variovorax paradoxus]
MRSTFSVGLTLIAAAAVLSGCAMAPATPAAPAAGSSHLDTVQKAAALRICTPGDYKPFSFQKADGSFEGIDVDLMTGFSASLGAKPEWVKTTWANLLPDLAAGKCDMAVGGVSVTTDRQKRAFFSAPYMVNGKAPIARCADVAKYRTVADIDKPSTRVIFNPGGSNERFARANFKQAKLTMHGENVTIFDEILANRADVFVTESAEAITQQKLKPGLCAINPDKPLQYGEMAWMLPRDDVAFKAYVDQWLHLQQAGGDFQRVMDRWLK